MGRWRLDEFIFGKEALDKWDRERGGQKNERWLTQEEKKTIEKTIEENNFRNEFYKLGNGQIFRIEELPEIFKKRIIQKCGSLEKEKLKEYAKDNERIALFSRYARMTFLGGHEFEYGGFLYVENNKGDWALKSYLEREMGSTYYD